MMQNPGLVAPLTGMVTAAAAITAARPTLAGDGVDITTWLVAGKFKPSRATFFLIPDGADRTIGAPTGGTAGFVEVWAYRPDRTGTKKWLLCATLPNYGGASIPLINASGGYIAGPISIPAGTERLHVAGTPSAGAPTYHVEPIEEFV